MDLKLTLRNACAIIILMHVSNSIIIGFPSKIGSDSWIAILVSLGAVLPLMLVYARLVHLMPGKDLFGMLESLFGRTATAVLCALYAFYFLSLTGIVRGNYAEFVRLTSLFNTPFVLINLAFLVVCSYLAISGAETVGKWCSIMLVLGIVTYVVITLFSAKRMNVQNLLPLLENGIRNVLVDAVKVVPLPMGETVAVLCLMDGLEKKANPYKLFLVSCILSTIMLAAIFLQNCAVLGADLMEKSYFPSYKAASVLHVGSIGSRVEAVVAFVFILAGISKVATCLIASAKAVKGIFNVKDHRPLLLPIGFLTVAISAHVFRNIVEMFDFVKVYRVYAIPFQILIPVAAWIAAEVKARKSGRTVPKGWNEAPQQAG